MIKHLNISEGMDGVGGNRTLRFRTALGSTNETIGCLDFAVAVGCIDADPIAMDALQHVRATLMNLVKRKR